MCVACSLYLRVCFPRAATGESRFYGGKMRSAARHWLIFSLAFFPFFSFLCEAAVVHGAFLWTWRFRGRGGIGGMGS